MISLHTVNEEIADKARKSAKKYMWLIKDDMVLDPTGPDGQLPSKISYLFGLYQCNTLLARINEPPVNKDCNVALKEFVQGTADLEIIAERDILGGG